MSYQWYALHVRHRFEKYVGNQLSDKGYETFVPAYIARRKWSDRDKSVTLPLFPSYVFCRFNVHARLPVLTTPGVNSILGVGKSPSPVDEVEIAFLRQVIDSGAPAQPSPYVSVGELVLVENGPLKGVVGIVAQVRGGHRLIVSVSLLMRSISVEIDRSHVRSLGMPQFSAPMAEPRSLELNVISTSRVRAR